MMTPISEHTPVIDEKADLVAQATIASPSTGELASVAEHQDSLLSSTASAEHTPSESQHSGTDGPLEESPEATAATTPANASPPLPIYLTAQPALPALNPWKKTATVQPLDIIVDTPQVQQQQQQEVGASLANASRSASGTPSPKAVLTGKKKQWVTIEEVSSSVALSFGTAPGTNEEGNPSSRPARGHHTEAGLHSQQQQQQHGGEERHSMSRRVHGGQSNNSGSAYQSRPGHPRSNNSGSNAGGEDQSASDPSATSQAPYRPRSTNSPYPVSTTGYQSRSSGSYSTAQSGAPSTGTQQQQPSNAKRAHAAAYHPHHNQYHNRQGHGQAQGRSPPPRPHSQPTRVPILVDSSTESSINYQPEQAVEATSRTNAQAEMINHEVETSGHSQEHLAKIDTHDVGAQQQQQQQQRHEEEGGYSSGYQGSLPGQGSDANGYFNQGQNRTNNPNARRQRTSASAYATFTTGVSVGAPYVSQASNGNPAVNAPVATAPGSIPHGPLSQQARNSVNVRRRPAAPMQPHQQQLQQQQQQQPAQLYYSQGGNAQVPSTQVPLSAYQQQQQQLAAYQEQYVRSALRFQIEYYLSLENLLRDIYLRAHMDEQGWINLTFIASFNRVKFYSTDLHWIASCLVDSAILEVRQVSNKDGKISEVQPFPAAAVPPTAAVDGQDPPTATFQVRKRSDWQQWVFPPDVKAGILAQFEARLAASQQQAGREESQRIEERLENVHLNESHSQ